MSGLNPSIDGTIALVLCYVTTPYSRQNVFQKNVDSNVSMNYLVIKEDSTSSLAK